MTFLYGTDIDPQGNDWVGVSPGFRQPLCCHDIFCSFLSLFNHFVNFFNQPIMTLGVENIIKSTEMFCNSILLKKLHHIIRCHIFSLCVLFYAERDEEGYVFVFFVHRYELKQFSASDLFSYIN